MSPPAKLINSWARRVVTSPYSYILWPAVIAFILAYPLVYSSLSSGLPQIPLSQTASRLTDTQVWHVYQAVVVPPIFINPVRNDALLARVRLLTEQLDKQPDKQLDVDEDRPDHVHHAQLLLGNRTVDLPYVHLFDTDIDPSDKPLLHSVLLDPRSQSGVVLSARALFITYISDSPNALDVWTRTIFGNDSAIHHQASHLVATDSAMPSRDEESRFSLSRDFNIFPGLPRLLLPVFLAYCFVSIYRTLAFAEIRSVRSVMGLVIAYWVQLMLSLFSAATIVSVVNGNFTATAICRFAGLAVLVAMVSIENTLRLINSVDRTPSEATPLARVTSALTSSAAGSVGLVAQNVAVLGGGILALSLIDKPDPLLCEVGTPCSQRPAEGAIYALLFALIAMLVNLLMHLTFFSAVLSVDLHRLELHDLISSAELTQPLVDKPETSHSLRQWKLRTLLYINYFYPQQAFPVLRTIVFTLCIILAARGLLWSNSTADLRNLLTTSSLSHPETTLFIWPFLQHQILECSNITNSLSVMLDINDPVTLNYDALSDRLRPAPPMSSLASTTGGFALFFILEFAASLLFVVGVSACIMHVMLPPRKYWNRKNAATQTASFSSKDLIGYHTLDVMQVIAHRSWIATVSLDHKVCVWNAATDSKTSSTFNSRAGSPASSVAQRPSPKDVTLIPILDQFWPVSKLALNGTSKLVALASVRACQVDLWDFGTRRLLYSFQDSKVLRALPVKMFISGRTVCIVTQDGLFVTITDTGLVTTKPIQKSGKCSEVVSACRLMTPKISMKVICLFADGSVVVMTRIGENEWHHRSLELFEAVSAAGNKVYNPLGADTSGYHRGVAPSLAYVPGIRAWAPKERAVTIVPIPAIHMFLLATGSVASLLDVNTGVAVRHIQLGQFKVNSLRVFHAPPTHCRFCGCASIKSISIAYTDLEQQGRVICHTLSIENRAKKNICLRIERDPRETRCVGFDVTNEHLHWIDSVEGWEAIDINMMMGVRRKEQPIGSGGSSIQQSSTSSSLVGRVTTNGSEVPAASSSFRLPRASPANVSRRQPIQKKPPLNITWEGWAMSGTGQVTYYDIPDVPKQARLYGGATSGGAASSRLLIRKIGPVTKYGQKSICVAFGNIIKILYFGCEEFHDDFEYEEPANGGFHGSGAKKWRREVAY